MLDRIRILYIYHTSQIGGGSFCLYNIIDRLDKKRYKPIVLLKSKGPLCKMLENCGAEIYIENSISTVPYNTSIFNITSIKRLFFILYSIPRLKKIFKRLHPDIIYINTMMMYPYLKIAKNLNIKTIIHIREHWPCNEHTMQFNFAKKNIIKYSDHIVAINLTSAKMINALSKTSIIYDWIDFTERDEFFSFENIFGKNYKSLNIFTFTGGIDPIKGTMTVVKLFTSKINNPDARLLILGADTTLKYKGFRGNIARFFTFLNCDTYSNKVKKMILNDNRIVCLPSTYNIKQIIENSYCILSYFTIPHANLILAESICLGQIVIAASTPEALEYSNNGASALLFKMNDPNDFIIKINDLMRNYNHYKYCAKNGTDHNNFLFNPIKNSKLLNNVYENIII